MAETKQTVEAMPRQVEIVYKDALDNLMFIKKQQWVVTGYALAAYAALFTVAKTINATHVDGRLIIGLVWVAALFSIVVLFSFNDALAKFRSALGRSIASIFCLSYAVAYSSTYPKIGSIQMGSRLG